MVRYRNLMRSEHIWALSNWMMYHIVPPFFLGPSEGSLVDLTRYRWIPCDETSEICVKLELQVEHQEAGSTSSLAKAADGEGPAAGSSFLSWRHATITPS